MNKKKFREDYHSISDNIIDQITNHFWQPDIDSVINIHLWGDLEKKMLNRVYFNIKNRVYEHVSEEVWHDMRSRMN